MNELEVERLIVRLMGDGSDFEQMINEAQELTSQLGDEMRRLGGSEKDYTRTMEQAAAVTRNATAASASYLKEFYRLSDELVAGKIDMDQFTASVQKLTAANGPAGVAFANQVNAMQKGLAMTRATENASERYKRQMQELNSVMASGAISQETYNRVLAKANAELRGSGAGIEGLGRSVQGFGAMWSVGITAPISAFLGVAANSAMKMEQMKLGLTAMAGSAEAMEAQLADLREVAKLPGLNLEQAVQGSIRLQAVKMSAGMASRALKSFGNALATVGKGAADLDGVVLAITQMVAKGKVSAEEINQISERMPQIREAMKEAFGTADTELLQKMGMKPEEFIQGIITQFEKLPQVAGGAANTMENFKDTVSQAMVTIGNVVLQIFMPAMDAAANMVSGMAQWFQSWSPAVQKAAIVIAMLVAAIGPLVGIIGTAMVMAGQLSFAYTTLAASATTAAAAQTALSVASGLAQAGLVGLAIAGIAAVSYAIYQAMPAIQAFNTEVERSGKLANEMSERQSKAFQKVMESGKALETGAQQKKFFEGALKDSEKELAGLGWQLANTKKNVEELAPTWLSMGQAGKKVWEAENIRLKETQASYDAAKKNIAAIKSELEAISQASGKGPHISPQTLKSYEALVKNMEAQIATGGHASQELAITKLQMAGLGDEALKTLRKLDQQNVSVMNTRKKQEELAKNTENLTEKLLHEANTAGMTADAIQRYDLAQAGAGAETLATVEALQKMRDAAVLSADITKLTEELDKQAAQMGMTADQIKLMELADRGASAETLAQVEALQKRNAALQATQGAKELVADLEKQILTFGMASDKIALYDLAQKGASQTVLDMASALQDQLKLMSDGKAMMEKHQTPLQKFSKQYEELAKLFQAGVIDPRTFNEELQAITKELDDAQAKATVTVTFAVGNNDAVRAGTEEFNNLLNDVAKNSAKLGFDQHVAAVKSNIDLKVAAEIPKLPLPRSIPSLPGMPAIPTLPPPGSMMPGSPVPVMPPATRGPNDLSPKEESLLTRIALATEKSSAREQIVLQEAGLS